ncbi:MAG: N-acetyl sugar amidotransferase [Micavibrio aeruginosavorus]|uniref:N-acetyl sugar amidotransferase n=1 Tax=Micavibrio aeruginosavorus TaxID=349221 RepID=A0A7T5UHI1_9BACT|nr:MAG: N-acetyl sugar amidotransferase [Micavibrio aeruginosavorus]
MHYCVRCGMPSSEEEHQLDELGICITCRSQEQKMHMNWAEREQMLRDILDKYRGKGDYDCIVAISGGKDSAWQMHMVKNVYGLKPLAVTFNQNWHSEVGRRNLEWCLETFDVDHLMFTPARSLVNRTARRSLEAIGDACWHCHMGVGSFPWQAAVKYNIPLMIFGESVAENSCKGTYDSLLEFNQDYFVKVSAKVPTEEFACEYLSLRDLAPFRLPSYEEIKNKGVIALHLGNYVFWDGEKQTEILRDRYGWKEDRVEGTYKQYKSVECVMPGVHDFTKFLKRGYGRGTDFAAQDRRAGLMTREEANELVREYDPVEPEALEYYLEITGYSREEFYAIMDKQREKLGVLSKEEIAAALEDYKKRHGDKLKDREHILPERVKNLRSS